MRLACLLGSHDYREYKTPVRWALRCDGCGRTTAGVAIGPRANRPRFVGHKRDPRVIVEELHTAWAAHQIVATEER